jgi:hypothetical protein
MEIPGAYLSDGPAASCKYAEELLAFQRKYEHLEEVRGIIEEIKKFKAKRKKKEPAVA